MPGWLTRQNVAEKCVDESAIIMFADATALSSAIYICHLDQSLMSWVLLQ